ncbi:dipeptidase [Kordiimonas aestuarii]|uniref:dipeptidase n=1 Tax=Kordiimonas aestuarii TaxID=1005925 RepID=UPI0021CE3F2B|nr:dipeptidase [Kordiimonas aestuarii]
MQFDRRTFLAGAAATGAAALTPRAASALQGKDLMALYDNAVVIDTLSFAHKWDDEEYEAVKQSGYTGIITSLNRHSLKVALDQLLEWHQRVDEHPDRYMFALKADDFLAAKKAGRMAVMMNFQNATMLEGDVDNIDILYEMGMRCFQLTYNSRNLVGDGSTERTNAGLSDFGVAVVERMNKLGILVDVSHSGKQTTLDAIDVSRKPIAFTHTMCESLRPGHPRAKEDAVLKKLAESGGVAGIAALGYFLGKNPGTETTIETYVDHIDHAVKVMGIDHVGLATDFPVRGIASWATRENWYDPRLKSFKPVYDVQWPSWIPELDTPDRFRNVLPILDRRGYSTGDMEKLLGQNWLRLFRETLG